MVMVLLDLLAFVHCTIRLHQFTTKLNQVFIIKLHLHRDFQATDPVILPPGICIFTSFHSKLFPQTLILLTEGSHVGMKDLCLNSSGL